MPSNASNASPRDPAPASGRGRLHPLALLRNYFFAGFAVAVPIIVTAWLLVLSYRFMLFVGRPVIEMVFRGINLAVERSAEPRDPIAPPEWFLNLFAILTPVVLFIFLGIMARNVIGARLLALMDRILLKFPVISFIYSGLKQVMDSFRNFGAGRNFKRVAYVEYPSPGCRLIGFVTGQYHDAQVAKDVTSIFIPTSPNPMTGFVIVTDDDKVFESSLSIEEATKIILSAGLAAPDSSLASPVLPRTDPLAAEASPGSANFAPTTTAAPPPFIGDDDDTGPIAPEIADPNQSVMPFMEGGQDPVVRNEEPVANHHETVFDGGTGYETEDL